MESILQLPGVVLASTVLLGLTSMLLLLGRSWRWIAGGLALQYLGVFILTAFSWALLFAFVKLVAGWMAVLILWVAIANQPEGWPQEQLEWANVIFRTLAAGITILVMIAISQGVSSWLPQVDQPVITGALLLGGLGLLHLGLTTQPLRVIIGLLTVLSGFEILYAALENSLLVAGLLSLLNLGIALAGAYIVQLPFIEEPPA